MVLFLFTKETKAIDDGVFVGPDEWFKMKKYGFDGKSRKCHQHENQSRFEGYC